VSVLRAYAAASFGSVLALLSATAGAEPEAASAPAIEAATGAATVAAAPATTAPPRAVTMPRAQPTHTVTPHAAAPAPAVRSASSPVTTAVPVTAPVDAAPPVTAAALPSPVSAAPAPSQAANNGDKSAPSWLRKDPKSTAPALATKEGPSPWRVGGMLLLVAVLGGVAYYARRQRQATPKTQPKTAPRVVGSTRIGAKATAVVVEVAGKRILLGVTEHSVNNLAWLDDEPNQAAEEGEVSTLRAAPNMARPSEAPEAQGPSGFLKVLRSAVGSSAIREVIPSDEVAKVTRDEVRLTRTKSNARREVEVTRELDDQLLEGQVMGLAKRRKEKP
jgi:flagellar biogenesis protein FliO